MQMSLNNIGLRIARMFPKLLSWQAVTVHVLCLVPPSLSCAFSQYLAPAPPGVTLQTCSKTPVGPQLRRNENFKNASNCILAKSLQSCLAAVQCTCSWWRQRCLRSLTPAKSEPRWSEAVKLPPTKQDLLVPNAPMLHHHGLAGPNPVLFMCVHVYWESAALQWALHGVRTAATWRSAGEGEGERREGGGGELL